MSIYRRGAIYWWRRNSPLRRPTFPPITIRLSLQTASVAEAKARAAALELSWDMVEATVGTTLRPDLTLEDLRRIYHLAFNTELGRIIVRQAATPMLEQEHAEANRTYAHLFTKLAWCAEPPHPDADTVQALMDEGFSAEDAQKLHDVIGRHRVFLPITPNQISAYLVEAGVYANDMNRKAVGRIVASAYRNACLESSERLGRPLPAGTVRPLPGNLMGLLGIDPPHHDAVVGPASGSPTLPPIVSESIGSGQPHAMADGESTTMMAEMAIAARIKARIWDKERVRDVDAAVKLFVAANGDIAFASWEQRHLAATVALFSRLPVRYGFARKDPGTGEKGQESVQEALMRGDTLLEQWDEDPIAAEEAGLPRVGLGHITRKKHLTWLGALVTFATEVGLACPAPLNFAILRRGKESKRGDGGMVKKNAALVAWDASDLRHLLTAPIWTGCAGLWRRFEPGEIVFHDAWYWAPLIIVLHGCRSDEGCGLKLDDVFDQAPVPYFHFRPNAFRRLKTAASVRRVPINARLIELGFLDYVRAMRLLGHRALFPELHSEKMGFDHNFYDKIFEPLRACMFPSGTSRKKDRKDVDVRSIRSRCISHLRDIKAPKELRQAIVGHEVGDVHSDTYEEDPDPALLKPWVDRLSELLPEMQVFPLNLRPREWQRFGAPRGRPREDESD
ncbi:hypothetical protein HZF05_03110 [Sphingomonas sp. CGMCC 1.13654]|uniref:Integrase n=1 Tax=Sphingomonas chungangi TaxID=2683589 RepID=A0A838L2D2_9SPHN|nr:hypothetical protein [Sphingomonas chungangi]MBA2933080.1 hypothetical protein [Sphingomonas chungangi]MVW56700.1 hypothetical protein [Sphingomonas chungangi]